MKRRVLGWGMIAVSLLSFLLEPSRAAIAGSPTERDFATVIAVIDSGFSPYHFDFLASQMPSESSSLSPLLSQPPDRWLPGFPRPTTFASYRSLTLTLPASPGNSQAALHTADQAAWDSVQPSRADDINYRWIPGTKVIGALTFGAEPTDRVVNSTLSGTQTSIYGTGSREHGMGSASVAVGNLHGTCPECLLVFLKYSTDESAERALEWANGQPWIDAVSNSYGFGATPTGRDRIHSGGGLSMGRRASTRGQTIFFSAGNGVENQFTLPNTTLLSSQEGPDWVVTVAAISSHDRDYTGSGKPADIAGIGSGHPSAFGSLSAVDGEPFTGTSSATPQIAGTYASALHAVRSRLGWPRMQVEGNVASARVCRQPACRLTAAQVRSAFMAGAQPSTGGFTESTDLVGIPAAADSRFASEGYGTYRGLIDGRARYRSVLLNRIVRPLLSSGPDPARPPGEQNWFRVDSWCRQSIWGQWSGGSYVNELKTPLPTADPAWPTRTLLLRTCPYLTRAP